MAPSLIAIHQPNFLPWLGWWNKLARADSLVLLDHVQFPRRSRGTYVNRVKALVNGEPRWLTASVQRVEGMINIRDVRLSDAEPWREKLTRTLHHSYRRAAAFDEVFPRIEEILLNDEDRLAEYNERAIRSLAAALGLSGAEIVRSSDLEATGKATDLLIEIVREVGGDAYLAGGGAGGYQEDEKFERAGIELVRQDFEPEPYPQLASEFVPGLSIADALLNVGFERTRQLVAAEPISPEASASTS